MGRRFNRGQRIALYLRAGGWCQKCGAPLAGGWHADHDWAWSLGGRTDISNGQALCPACNWKKGNRLSGKDTFEMRQKQLDLAHLTVERARAKDSRIVIGRLFPGYGKEWGWQHTASMLYRQGLIDASVTYTPRTNLCIQAETNWYARDKKTGDESGRRFQYADPVPQKFVWPDGNQQPFYNASDKEFGYITTYQALTIKREPHIRWAQQHAGRFLLVGDEAAGLGGLALTPSDAERESNLQGECFAEMRQYAAATMLLTGAPERSDGRRLIGCEDRYYQKPGGRRWYLDADVKGLYTEGVASGILRPVEVMYVDAQGREVFDDGTESSVSIQDDGSLIARALRHAQCYEPICDATIDRVLGLRNQFNHSYGAGIACMDTDHARDVYAYVAEQAKQRGLSAAIAVSRDGQAARDVLARAQQGRLDILIFVRMAWIGFDWPLMSVLGNLSNIRFDSYLIQLDGRALRVAPGIPAEWQRAYLITLDDPKSREHYRRMVRDGELGLLARPDGPPPPPPPPVPPRDIRDWESGAQRHEVLDEEVDEGPWLDQLQVKYAIRMPMDRFRDLARDLQREAGGTATTTEEPMVEEKDVIHDTSVPETSQDRKSRYASLIERNARNLAGKRCRDTGDTFSVAKDYVSRKLSEGTYWGNEGNVPEARIKAKLEKSREWCRREGIDPY